MSELFFSHPINSVSLVITDGFPWVQFYFPNDIIPTCSPLTVRGPPESPPQLPTIPVPRKTLGTFQFQFYFQFLNILNVLLIVIFKELLIHKTL